METKAQLAQALNRIKELEGEKGDDKPEPSKVSPFKEG